MTRTATHAFTSTQADPDVCREHLWPRDAGDIGQQPVDAPRTKVSAMAARLNTCWREPFDSHFVFLRGEWRQHVDWSYHLTSVRKVDILELWPCDR